MSNAPKYPESYGAQGVVISNLPKPIESQIAPTSANKSYVPGQIWLDQAGQAAYIFINADSGTGNWVSMGSAGGPLDTLTGDTGAAVSPVVGNIDIVGTGGEIETAGSAGTITLALSSSLVAPGSLAVTTTLDVTGASTLAALTQVGTASINGSGAAATTIGSAAAGAVAIASGAASSFAVSGAGIDLTLDSAAGQLILTGGEAAANAVRIQADNAAGGIDIDCGTGGIAIDSTGAFSIDGAAASNVTVTGAGLDLTLSSVGGSVAIASDEAVATAINLTASDAAGGITLSAGTAGVNVAGNLNLSSVATHISMNGGAATDFIGSAVLVAGTVTVANTNIAANDRILVVRSTTGGTEGHLSYTINAGVEFVINSSDAGDTSTVVYVIFRQT